MTDSPDKNPNVIYPFNKEAIELSENDNNNNFNFGLWFNKFIPLKKDNYNVCDKSGDKDKAVDFYKDIYKKKIDERLLNKLLEKKHIFQHNACKSYKEKYDIVVLTAELLSPLITGIGQTHPSEVGMTFDHTLGIPYIPASSVKGIVRFSYTLELLNTLEEQNISQDDIGKYFDDEAEWTKISVIFGKGGNKDNKSNVGNVIFLDAYPLSVPELSVDIMNPHYGDYYTKGDPPADYLQPKPIKFLTVKKGTKFIFRVLINKTNSDKLKKSAETALKRALTEEGAGAKTAVGYGLFKINGSEEPESIQKSIKKAEDSLKDIEEKKKIDNMSEVDKICYDLTKPINEQEVTAIYNKIDLYDKEDKIKIAAALKERWSKEKKWNKKDKLSKKQKPKVDKIKSILGE